MLFIRITIIIFLVFALNLTSQSQDASKIRNNYAKRTAYLSGEKVIWNENKVKLKNFAPELMQYDNSRHEYLGYKRSDKNAFLWLGATIGGIIAAAASNNPNVRDVGAGLFIGGWIPFTLYKTKSVKRLNKSVWYYNQDALLDSKR